MDKDLFKNIDVSIIIVNYKDYDITERCISSVIKFTSGLSYEIILVDNNSDTGKAEKFKQKFCEVIYIANQENNGFAAANNQGLSKVKGKYVLLLNNDTLFIEDTLQKVYDFSEQNELSCFIGCKLLNEDLTHQESITDFDNLGNVLGENLFFYKVFPNIRIFNRYYLNRLDFDKQIEVDVIKGAFIFCPTKQLKSLGGFDESFFFYGEEVDLCYRFKAMGGKVIYLPTTSIIHIGRATSMKNLLFKFENQSKAKLKIYLKYSKGFKLFSMIAFHYIGIFLRIPIYLIFGLLKLNKITILKSYYYLRTLIILPTKI
jgi:hypothetical protein